jgi:hypothetical protein
MKAIPTKYNGKQFRSRLEARWSVFFDELNLWHLYEPFEILDKTGSKSYLPDFYVGLNGFEQRYFIEVKPIAPNDEYIEHLKSIYNPGLSSPLTILIVTGNPSFYQPNGVCISRRRTGKNGVLGYEVCADKGFAFERCQMCGIYKFIDHFGDTHLCRASEERSHDEAAQIAAEFRFDL